MSDAERDERLREARHLAGQSRDVLDKHYLDDALITLDDEVTRLDAVVTAVRAEVESWTTYPGHTAEAQYFRRYLGDLVRRALDGGAA